MFNLDMHALIPLFVALPLAASLLIQLLARGRPSLSGGLATVTMLALVLMSFHAIGGSSLYHLGGWPTPIARIAAMKMIARRVMIGCLR